MTPLRGTILIESSLEQKQSYTFENGVTFHIVPNRHLYDTNNRETQPVVGLVKQVGTGVPEHLIGKYVVVHHNLIFDQEFLVKTENGIRTSVLPYDRWILSFVDEDGDLRPLNKNLICERIEVPMVEGVTDASRKTEDNLMKVVASDFEDICRNDTIIVYKYADYEVVYQWNNEVRRQVVVTNEDVVGTYIKAGRRLTNHPLFGLTRMYMSSKKKVLRDKVLVKPDTAPAQSAGGFVVPGNADIKVLQGKVIAVGPGERATGTGELIPMEAKVGDTAHFGKNAGAKVVVDGEEYLVLFEREILLVTDK